MIKQTFWEKVVTATFSYGAEMTSPTITRHVATKIWAQFLWDHFWGKQLDLGTCADGTEIVLLNENHDERPSEMRPLTNEEVDLPLPHPRN